MHPLARRRCLAHLLDCAGYLGIAAATIPVGVLLATTTDLGSSRLYGHLASAVPPAIATVIAARAESGPHRATWGKRRQGLTVQAADGTALGTGPALARNLAKIFLPWQLGHVCAVGAAWGGFEDGDALTIGASIAVYPVIGIYVWTGLHGSGRGPHDVLAGSSVVPRTPAPAAGSVTSAP
ncbi:hypothetical protein CFK38_05790 [Brachybacterium vulturis]|uniref:RDD domain-containing protein n=1 Tax=Brachybacterium vulturis TaxID=2017484 RepID=A0A291GSB2_9MICO|nr:RDD family protein [Brachybacterium vulturis]ATG53125.1 hypothetical protein CFK38_05790 [Brachybacterium vulturis]